MWMVCELSLYDNVHIKSCLSKRPPHVRARNVPHVRRKYKFLTHGKYNSLVYLGSGKPPKLLERKSNDIQYECRLYNIISRQGMILCHFVLKLPRCRWYSNIADGDPENVVLKWLHTFKDSLANSNDMCSLENYRFRHKSNIYKSTYKISLIN